MEELIVLATKSVFFFVLGVALSSLFVWCFIQGIQTHLSGDSLTALLLYLLAFFAGFGAFGNYKQASQMLHFAKMI